MHYFVRSAGLSGFPELVRELGESPGALLRHVGLSTAVLDTPDLYIPYTALAALLNAAAERCDAADFGARLGGRQGLHIVGALGSLMCLQSTLPDALTMMQRNLDFHARGVQVEVDTLGNALHLRLSLAFDNQIDCSQLHALSVALLYRSVAQLHQSPLNVSEVQLKLTKPASTTVYQEIFSAPVVFGAAENRLIYPRSLIDTPVNPIPTLRRELSKQWRGNWQPRHSDPLPQQIKRVISDLLPTGECNLEMVAQIVELHPRSLQLRLQQSHTGFSELLKSVRLDLAYQYLQNSDIALTSLAMNLGFAELAVFSRAFKKWTGISPRDWRKQAQLQSAQSKAATATPASSPSGRR